MDMKINKKRIIRFFSTIIISSLISSLMVVLIQFILNKNINYYNENIEMDDLITYSSLFNNHLDGSVIYNNYNDFIRKTTHLIIGKM